MRRIRLGNTEVDGEATGPQGDRIAIEIKTPRDDLARGIGQLAEALAFDYHKAVLVTTLRNAKKIDDRVFKKFDFLLIGIDSTGKIRYSPFAADGNEIVISNIKSQWIMKMLGRDGLPKLNELKRDSIFTT